MAWGVLVFDVSGDRRACGGEVVKAVLPSAFLVEGADEPLAQPVMFGRVGRDVFLREAVVAHESTVGPRVEDKAVVAEAQGEACGSATGGAEAMQQGLFQRPIDRFGASGVRRFPAADVAQAAVDDRHEGAASVATAIHGGDVGGPALVGCCGDGLEVLHMRSASGVARLSRPAMQAHDAVRLLAVDDHALAFGEAGMSYAHAIDGMSFRAPHG